MGASHAIPLDALLAQDGNSGDMLRDFSWAFCPERELFGPLRIELKQGPPWLRLDLDGNASSNCPLTDLEEIEPSLPLRVIFSGQVASEAELRIDTRRTATGGDD